MELERTIEILEKHQAWRRDKNVPPITEMQSPIEIGTAIDSAISELKKTHEGVQKKTDTNEFNYMQVLFGKHYLGVVALVIIICLCAL